MKRGKLAKMAHYSGIHDTSIPSLQEGTSLKIHLKMSKVSCIFIGVALTEKAIWSSASFLHQNYSGIRYIMQKPRNWDSYWLSTWCIPVLRLKYNKM